ncbi:hypothetical protein ACOMHN_001140 [Nucella lapillus]
MTSFSASNAMRMQTLSTENRIMEDDDSATENVSPANLPCTERQSSVSQLLGGLLLKVGVLDEDTLTKNNISPNLYVEFTFKHPVRVYGWVVRGRVGGMLGPLERRRGFVASYVVTFQDADGQVQILDDPSTDEEEFVSEGNLARPEELSIVELEEEVEFVSEGNLAQPEKLSIVELEEEVVTQTIRMSPIVWSGVPYMAVRLFYCAKDEEEKSEKEPSTMQQAMASTTGGTFALNLETAKSELGVAPPAQAKQTTDTKPVGDSPHLPYTHCLNPATWRYASQSSPVDQFSALGNPNQAWRAILGVHYTPYLFPSLADSEAHNNPLLEVSFRKKSRVDALKVAGLAEGGEPGKWGVVTKFQLLYKDPLTEKWVYNRDSSGMARVFKTDKTRTRDNAQEVSVFHLPAPINTFSMGLFPLAWANRPYLALDFLACYTEPIEMKPKTPEAPPEETKINIQTEVEEKKEISGGKEVAKKEKKRVKKKIKQKKRKKGKKKGAKKIKKVQKKEKKTKKLKKKKKKGKQKGVGKPKTKKLKGKRKQKVKNKIRKVTIKKKGKPEKKGKKKKGGKKGKKKSKKILKKTSKKGVGKKGKKKSKVIKKTITSKKGEGKKGKKKKRGGKGKKKGKKGGKAKAAEITKKTETITITENVEKGGNNTSTSILDEILDEAATLEESLSQTKKKGQSELKEAERNAADQCDVGDSVVADDGKPTPIQFNEVDGQQLSNTDNATFSLLRPPRTVTSLLLATPVDRMEDGQTVQSFVVRYKADGGNSTHWETFQHRGKNKVFKYWYPYPVFKPQVRSFFQALPLLIPEKVTFLQILPKKWNGTHPQMLVDVLGC